jgi:hypothetical protein
MSINLNTILQNAGLVSIRDIYDDVKNGVGTAYTDAEENISEVGRGIERTKDDVIETTQSTLFYVYIFSFSGLLLFGPQVFQVFSDISARIKQGGVNVGFRL